MVAGAEECGAGAGEDLEEEKGINTTMIQYFRGTFHSCMGTMPMLFTWQGLLV
jgi:hypothetical protein